MSQQGARTHRFWAALAVVAVPVLIFHGCTLLATDGESYSGHRPWEFTVLTAFMAAAALTVAFYASALSKGATIEILDDRLVHPRWKQPIYFNDIKAVTFVANEFWGKRSLDVQLELRDATTQLLPRLLLPTGPTRFAQDLRKALDARQIDTSSLS